MSKTPHSKRVSTVGLALFLGVGLLAMVLGAVQNAAAQTYDCAAASGIDEDDCKALVALWTDTGGPAWFTDTNWLGNNTPCGNWYGVTCSGERVVSLSLLDNNLSGQLPAQLSDLSELQVLNLFSNTLTGTLPTFLPDLSELQVLNLSRNQFEGPIPADLGLLDKLDSLYLNNNRLTGEIPPQLGDLLNMLLFYLNGNMLEGVVPPELCTLVTKSDPNPEILVFDISHNKLDISDSSSVCFDTADVDWRAQQTVPPELLELDTSVPNEITVRWRPISYTEGTGGYEIFMSDDPDDFEPDPSRRTQFLSDEEATFAGLTTGETKYFKLRTQMNPNDFNDNLVTSAFGPVASADVVALSLLAFEATQAWPSWLLWGALLLGLLLVPLGVSRLARKAATGRDAAE